MADPERGRRSALLSTEDVTRLLKQPSASVRREIVDKIAADYRTGSLSERERTIATEIFRLLLRDAEVMVRRAMSEALKDTRLVPHDVAVALASDLAEVALPMLESSQVLSDMDLIDIIRNPIAVVFLEEDDDPDLLIAERSGTDPGEKTAKHTAIAGRKSVSSKVAMALVEKGSEDVIITLVRNKGAEISEFIGHRVVDRFGDHEGVQTALIDRSAVPISVMERLVFLVSDALRTKLTKSHGIAASMGRTLAILAGERATLELLGHKPNQDTVDKLILQLRQKKRLSPTLILRAICMGERLFVELAFSRMTSLARQSVREILTAGDTGAMHDLFNSARIPGPFYKAMEIALQAAMALPPPTDQTRSAYTEAVLNALLRGVDPRPRPVGVADLDYVLARVITRAR